VHRRCARARAHGGGGDCAGSARLEGSGDRAGAQALGEDDGDGAVGDDQCAELLFGVSQDCAAACRYR